MKKQALHKYLLTLKSCALTLLMLVPVFMSAQFFDTYFGKTGETWPYINLLSTGEHIENKAEGIKRLANELGLIKQSDRIARIGDDTVHITEKFDHQFYLSKNSKNEFHRISSKEGDKLYDLFKSALNKIGWHTGGGSSRGTLHQMEVKVDDPTSICIMIYSGYDIFFITHKLDFGIPTRSDELTHEQHEIIFIGLDDIHKITAALANKVLTPAAKKQLPDPNKKNLTVDERLFGLSKFWSEVKYNFAFFHQVPDLDWDAEYQQLIPEVVKEQSDYDYYQKLSKFCALLNDGHTNIYLPSKLSKQEVFPAIKLKSLEEKVIVSNIADSLEVSLPVGSEITHVNNVPVKEFMQEKILPYISSSTEYIKRSNATRNLLKGKSGQTFTLSIVMPDMQKQMVTVNCNTVSNINWVIKNPKWSLIDTASLEGDLFYFSANSFGNASVIEEFEKHISLIQKSKGLIIDLRKNGGGNSTNGYGILKYLTNKEFITSSWSTREHRGSYKAWGINNVGTRNEARHANGEHLSDWDRDAWKYAKGTKWHLSQPDTIQPSDSIYLDLPVVVLMGNNTASAAEDFLIAASSMNNITTMGQKSYGSTGQPLMFDLPGGGRARICTKKDTYPDGKEFVGYGIQPDIYIKETVKDFLSKYDRSLEEAKKYLKEKSSTKK